LQRRRFSAARRDVIARQSACRHDLPRACRTISRFLYLRFRRRQPFLLAGDLSPAPATYPELVAERAAPRPLFGLAPHGVCPANRITAAAVRSYRTFSPLPSPADRSWRYIFCGTFRKARFERAPPAVSRHAALRRPDFPPTRRFSHQAGGCPSGRPSFHYETLVASSGSLSQSCILFSAVPLHLFAVLKTS